MKNPHVQAGTLGYGDAVKFGDEVAYIVQNKPSAYPGVMYITYTYASPTASAYDTSTGFYRTTEMMEKIK